MLGIYSISGREVSTSTVAAILTILGYSIYDTIIVFDRVRENMKLMPRATIATDRERLGVGDDAALDLHVVDHAAADRRPVHLRRLDAAGLRVRDPRRHLGRRRIHDLHRDAAARRADGARPGVRAPARRGAFARPDRGAGGRGDPRRRGGGGRGRAGARSVSPVAAVERAVSGAEAKRERRRQRRSSRPHGRAR